MKKIIAYALSIILCLSVLPIDSVHAQKEGVEQEVETDTVRPSSSSDSYANDDAEGSNNTADNIDNTGNTNIPGNIGNAVDNDGNTGSTDNTNDTDNGTGTQEETKTDAGVNDLGNVGNAESNTIDVEKEILLNYLLVEKGYLEAGDTQNIVVSLGDEEKHVSKAVLEYRNDTNGQVYQMESITNSEDGLLFQMIAQEEGIYTLLSVSFTYAEQTGCIVLSDIGINVQFGVGVAVDVEADDYLIDASALDVESSIVSVGEDGVIESESIAEALEGAATYRMRSRRAGNLVVVLDPGHDSTHAGAQKYGYGEEKLVLKIAKYCKAELEQYNGVTVYLTRESDACANGGSSVNSTTCNARRVEFAVAKGADVFVSFHLNSSTNSGAMGAGVYYPNASYRPDLGQEGHDLGRLIVNNLTSLGLHEWAGGTLIHNSEDGTTYPDGSLADYLGVIRRSKLAGIPAVLIEHAFLSNSSDVNNFLSSDEKLKQLGEADAKAIADYYGLQKGVAFGFKQLNLGSEKVAVGNNAQLYYALNKDANVSVHLFYGNNVYMKTLVSDKAVGTDEQIATWDLKDNTGEYVPDGTYRFTIIATTSAGERVESHKWFTVSGNAPFSYKWANLGSGNVKIGDNAQLYYALNKDANVTVHMFYGNNVYMKTLVSDKAVGTNEQVATWDLKDAAGEYVPNGTYRFTVIATTAKGERVETHKWFTVSGNDPLSYKWTNLGSGDVRIGNNAQLYYALNKDANVTVHMFYGDNVYMKTLVSNKEVGTNEQIATWDLKDNNGEYVPNGTYRFTVVATTAKGERVETHKWFTVSGNDPLSYKWTNLGSGNVRIGNNAQLYYAVNKDAKVTVHMFYGNNVYMKTLVSNMQIGTNDQVATWDLKDAAGEYVPNGTYRFTVVATTAKGERVEAHKWFTVSGNTPLSYKWTNLGSGNVRIGNNAQLYYAVNKDAKVTVHMFYGNNVYMKTLVSNMQIGTNDQVATWDLKDAAGEYVPNGTYRFTVIATTAKGERVETHKWFTVSGNDPLSYKWTNLGSGNVRIGNNAQLYYAVNKDAKVTVHMFYGNNVYMKTLVSNMQIGTNDQVATWDLKDAAGEYVPNGTYRFTVIATTAKGEQVEAHKWFTVSGNDPLSYRWTNLGSTNVAGGSSAQLYYAVNKNAEVTVHMFYGNNNFMKTLVSNMQVGTNDQVIVWDLKDGSGNYVSSGQYRFTITAKTKNGESVTAHKYFNVSNYSIMGTSNTTVDKMVAFYNARYTYPRFYANTEAPTIRDFCQIYYEECAAEGVKAEVAFCQSMKETGYLQYPGATCVVKPEQYNFAGLDTTGEILPNGKVDAGRSYTGVRQGIRAHVQRLKAYAVKGTTPSSFAYPCIDDDKYTSAWWRSTIVGSAPYVEWLGKSQNPSGFGWATDPNYGYSILNDYMRKLLSY